MKDFVKYITVVILQVAMIILLLVRIGQGKNEPQPTEFEIYTLENIYYIEGLKVANESNETLYTFGDTNSLKNYLIQVTTEDNQKGMDCLNGKAIE